MAKNNTTTSYGMETISGIGPDTSAVIMEPFTTQEIQKFLQDEFDTVVATVNRNIEDNGLQMPKLQNAKIRIQTVHMSKYLLPTLLIMPMSVAFAKKNKPQQKSANKGGINIGNIHEATNGGEQANGAVQLNKCFYSIIQQYMFEDAKRTFRNRAVQNYWDLTESKASMIIAHSKPVILKNGKDKSIGILLDTFAILHRMLRFKDDSLNQKEYNVVFHEVKKMGQGQYKFWVIRKTLTNKDKKRKGGDGEMQLLKKLENDGGFKSLH